MSMKYLKLVHTEKLSVGTDTATTVDTHGLMARLCIKSGSVYIGGQEDVASSASPSVDQGQETDFVGKVSLLGKGSAADVAILYFDKI